ncbi:hypothetical protein DBT_1147 [Dissulfuribacter thermophilus]|uniref:TIGR04255 family protein n=1 Tax=Dissulfuribacter thermophilus TaxID=1156395 RepID=A0A1B9F670_9BACT|nr:hypothetical protein [Dissulfuribacter thermophilus]OCC15400.1 hypothetical protein DBT_1147 [Dissulfuribacter thermophilus]
MSIHKLIFRLDFEPNFQVIDSPGRILQLLHEAGGGKDWPELGETREKRTITGKIFDREGGWLASITIDPVAISGYMESISGLSLEKIEDSTPISRLFRITNKIRQEFSINIFKRTGLRMFLFETEEETNLVKSACQKGFYRLYEQDLLSVLQENLGSSTDCGMAFDGINDEEMQYHIKWGPYRESELRQHLKEFHSIYKNCSSDPFPPDENIILTIDIDLFETDHSISESISLAKWCRPMIERTLKLRKELFEIIKTKTE